VVEWTGAPAKGDNNAGWQEFVLAVFNFFAYVCYIQAHLGPIGANNGQRKEMCQ